jgi:hypothetical protein
LGFEFWDLRFGIWDLGFEFWDLGFWFLSKSILLSGSWLWVLDLGLRIEVVLKEDEEEAYN